MLAAQAIATGDVDVVVAGGMESMSQRALPAAARARRPAPGQRRAGRRDDPRRPVGRVRQLPHGHAAARSWPSTYGVTRAAAGRSSRWRATARRSPRIKAGKFEDEIVPVPIPQKKGEPVMLRPRRDAARGHDRWRRSRGSSPRSRRTAPSPPATRPASTTAPRRSSSCRRETAKALGRKPLARIVAQATRGLEPKMVMMTPVDAVRRLAEKTGWGPSDVDLVEINEAFAVQARRRRRASSELRSRARERQRRRGRARPSDRRERRARPHDAALRAAATAARSAASRRCASAAATAWRWRVEHGELDARMSACKSRRVDRRAGPWATGSRRCSRSRDTTVRAARR